MLITMVNIADNNHSKCLQNKSISFVVLYVGHLSHVQVCDFYAEQVLETKDKPVD